MEPRGEPDGTIQGGVLPRVQPQQQLRAAKNPIGQYHLHRARLMFSGDKDSTGEKERASEARSSSAGAERRSVGRDERSAAQAEG